MLTCFVGEFAQRVSDFNTDVVELAESGCQVKPHLGVGVPRREVKEEAGDDLVMIIGK
jgi:hypothetical protein